MINRAERESMPAIAHRPKRLYTQKVRPRLGGPVVVAIWVIACSALDLNAQEPERSPFIQWLAVVREEALTRGIRPAVVEEALSDITEPLAVVLDRDRSQAEIVLPLETYVSRRLTRRNVTSGRDMYARHRALLETIGGQYGVPGRIIVSIWGVESNYGRFSGVRPTVSSLATLAWDPRRSTYFRGELFSALEILNRGDIDLARMRGSWAGAMGQPQFMPSSYLRYAEDHDGDGRKDIWSSAGDVFASIANYLKGHGWRREERWGREVSMAPNIARRISAEVARRDGACRATRDMTVPRPLREWNQFGVKGRNGEPLPESDMSAALVSGASRHFLVYANYDALLSYNCAHAYALSVALLGDALEGDAAGGSPRSHSRGRTRVRRPERPSPDRSLAAPTDASVTPQPSSGH
ncbi:MAG: lytic murein transglycosylase [Acidimicrobiia bacterium]|nr:lytic murein transglycosylase [Acidimicrobiia bacterium]